MNYQLYCKNVIATDSLRRYLDMKLGHLDKFCKGMISCRVDLTRNQRHKKGDVFKVEFLMHFPKKLLRSIEKHEDIRAAIDIGTDSLQRQYKKYKSKQRSVRRRADKTIVKGSRAR